jgi:hypothetical protein
MDLHLLSAQPSPAQLEEVSVGYAAANDIDRTPDWSVLKLQEEVGELTQTYLTKFWLRFHPSRQVPAGAR